MWREKLISEFFQVNTISDQLCQDQRTIHRSLRQPFQSRERRRDKGGQVWDDEKNAKREEQIKDENILDSSREGHEENRWDREADYRVITARRGPCCHVTELQGRPRVTLKTTWPLSALPRGTILTLKLLLLQVQVLSLHDEWMNFLINCRTVYMHLCFFCF